MAPSRAKRTLTDAFCATGEAPNTRRTSRQIPATRSRRESTAAYAKHADGVESSVEGDSSGEYEVESAFLTGVVARIKKPDRKKKKKKKKKGSVEPVLYEIRWTTTQYQLAKHIHGISREKVLEGIANCNRLSGAELRSETWDVLCRPYQEEMQGGDIWDAFEQVDETSARYDCRESIPEDVGVIAAPDDLFAHADGATGPRIKDNFAPSFRHSTSSSFLAYLPLAFWKKVVGSTNAYAAAEKRQAVTLEELMNVLGILFYMALIDKGEYANYWGDQVEDALFGAESARMDGIMTLRRFIFIRKNLCFRHPVTSENLKGDPAARIRPLMNMLKVRAPKFVTLGRNVAVMNLASHVARDMLDI